VRRIQGATASLLLVLTACSSIESPPNAVDSGTQPPTDVSAGVLQEVSVIGAGRALQAASAAGAATVVATTIGVTVVDENGGATPFGSDVEPPASGITVSPDGTHAIVQGAARAELWSVEAAPALVAAFDTATHATFSADSSVLMTSSPLEVTTGAVAAASQTAIEAPAGTELGTATMTPDGLLIAAPVTGDGPDMITYTASTGSTAADIFAEPDRKVVRADFGGRPDRLLLQVSSTDPFEGQLAAWDPGAGQIVWETAAGSFSPSTAWDVGPDGRVLTGDGTTLRLIGLEGNVDGEWQLDATQTVTGIVATRSGYAVARSDGTLLLTGLDGARTGPSVAIGQRIVDLEPLTAVDGVVTVDAAGIVQVWRQDGTLLNEITSFRASAVNDVALSADGTSIAAAMAAGTVMVTDVTGSELPFLLEHPEGNVDSVAFSPAGDRLVTGVGERLSDIAFDDTVSTWSLADGLRTAQSGGEGEDVNGCANFRNTVRYSPNGDLFASASHDFTVEIHGADAGEVVATLPPHISTVLDVVFSPNGDRLVTSSDDGAVRVWSTADFALQSEFVGPPGGYWSLAFMPDGGSLIASDLTGAIRRIDVATGAEILTFGGSTTRNGRLAVSPDGAFVAAASDGNSIGVWSTETGQLIGSAEGHRSPVTSAVFSSDGSILVTGSGDTTVRTWRVAEA
jgi:WD40 repeat protein